MSLGNSFNGKILDNRSHRFLANNRSMDIGALFLYPSVCNRIHRSHEEYQLVIDSKLILKVKY